MAIAAEPRLPTSIGAARRLAAVCHRCPLYRNAIQTVFGEGPTTAAIFLVGEQPGDEEDKQGRPFVGPAGRMLDRALTDAGIDRDAVYVTNAVKHFKNEPRGKKRLHRRPNTSEIEACKWWLDLERRLVRPEVIVALGATGLLAVTGRPTSITSLRGEIQHLDDGSSLIATIHPSYLLRMPDRTIARQEYRAFVNDLGRARDAALANGAREAMQA
jgi:DNA polymerase